jgi:heme/copper-type cytochrome/quinol oxidase subunit 2
MSHDPIKQAEHEATRRLTFATHLLVVATVILSILTGMLVWCSFQEASTKAHETIEVPINQDHSTEKG